MVGSETQNKAAVKIPAWRGVIIPAAESVQVVTQAVLFICQVIDAGKQFNFVFSQLFLPTQPELPETISGGIYIIGIGKG